MVINKAVMFAKSYISLFTFARNFGLYTIILGTRAMIHHRIAEVIHTTPEFDLVGPPPEELRAAGAEVVLFVPG
jgi:hypothetical protein